jgi:hypothetical protein
MVVFVSVFFQNRDARWRACEGELVQIIKRARGVNRESDAMRVDIV